MHQKVGAILLVLTANCTSAWCQQDEAPIALPKRGTVNPNKSFYIEHAATDEEEGVAARRLSTFQDDNVPISKLETKSFQLINDARKANGLKPLMLNKSLSNLARKYAHKMLDGKYFTHVDADGHSAQERALEAGITCGVYENLGWQSGMDASIRKVIDIHQSFMNEPKDEHNHRYIILLPAHQCVGIGIAKSGDELMLVQEFSDQNPDK